MPKISEDSSLEALETLEALGVEFSPMTADQYVASECPFCGKERKLYFAPETTKWDCKVCGRYGNLITFIRQFWESSSNSTSPKALEELAEDRGLLEVDTIRHWGVVKSHLKDEWLVPTFSGGMDVNNLARYGPRRRRDEETGEWFTKWELWWLPNLPRGLFGMNLYDRSDVSIHFCEGPWDAMAWWETLGYVSPEGKFTKSAKTNLGTRCSVFGVPGALQFSPEWIGYCKGKDVLFLYDSDHPKMKDGRRIPGSGIDGTRRATGKITASDTVTSSINYLYWGIEGFDPSKPSGTDVRDLLKGLDGKSDRADVVGDILHHSIRPVPEEWIKERGSEKKLDSVRCDSWAKVRAAWEKAFRWTKGHDRALSVMLASIISTGQTGDQLWIKLMGPPSCGKSRLCEAISVARKYVFPKSTIRGFHSGFKSDFEGTEDHSLLADWDGKTLVVKDGDTLLTAPNRDQILAEGRDIYDGVSRTHYRHALSRDYEGLRATWILCGTASLRQLDSSELGARFLDCIIMRKIDSEIEHDILLSVADRSEEAVSNTAAKGKEDHPEMLTAYKLTGGYVEHLRENAEEILSSIPMASYQKLRCVKLAKLVAYVRARPSTKQNETEERELGARLTSQLVRLAKCLAGVLQVPEVDEEVMERVRQVGLDTAEGKVLTLVKTLFASKRGKELLDLADRIGENEDGCRRILRFLKKIEAVESYSRRSVSGMRSPVRWRLTEEMKELYEDVFEEW